MGMQQQGLRTFRAVVVTMGVLIGAVFAAAIGEPDQAPDEPARPAHPLWSDVPPVPETVASGPTHVLEPEVHSIRSEHGVHAGIMAF
jgi:hypothetical protein